MGKIARYLNQLTVGNVFDSPDILEAYSTDRSALQIKPKAVAFPESTEDVRKLVRFCYQLAAKDIKVPIAVRGSGLDEVGGDLTNGLVISTEKLNKLLESDRRERLVRVQAGITLKELNTALSVNGLTIPIDGHDLDTIGGLISNCPADNYSGKYGGIMNYVERIEIVLSNGDCLQTSRFGKRSLARKSKERTLEGDIYRKLTKVIHVNNDIIEELKRSKFTKSGYSNIARASRRNTLDLLPLFFGAEGTLGVITEVILRAVPIKKRTSRVVATFDNFDMAKKFLDFAKDLKPRELNIYDIDIIKTAEESGKKLSDITKKLEEGYVVFVRFDDRNRSNIRKVMSVAKMLPRTSKIFIESGQANPKLDELENSLTSFLYYAKSGERIPLLTDFYVPADNMCAFITDLRVMEEKLGIDLALFGSYAASNYSLRPKFNLDDEDFSKKAVAFLRAGTYIIARQSGSITGGGPEGRTKAIVTNPDLTESKEAMYKEIKDIFDRYGVISPDIKMGADTRYTLRHFRSSGNAKIMV